MTRRGSAESALVWCLLLLLGAGIVYPLLQVLSVALIVDGRPSPAPLLAFFARPLFREALVHEVVDVGETPGERLDVGCEPPQLACGLTRDLRRAHAAWCFASNAALQPTTYGTGHSRRPMVKSGAVTFALPSMTKAASPPGRGR